MMKKRREEANGTIKTIKKIDYHGASPYHHGWHTSMWLNIRISCRTEETQLSRSSMNAEAMLLK